MKNLGKIVLFIFLVPQIIFASVTASIYPKSVELGEMVTFTLNISGENIKRPTVQILCDTAVISTASQTNIQNINGKYSKSYVLSYKFLPQKNCEIKPIEVKVDGKIQTSNPVKVIVKPLDATKEADFVLSLQSDKKEIFVGESFELTLLLKQKEGAEAVDHKFIPPELKGFWIKKESKSTSYRDGNYIITKIIYTMAPQRVGTLNIKKAKIRIASRSSTRDAWGSWTPNIRWRTYFSNDLNLEVKPLPLGVDLVGNFTIFTSIDKKEIDANEAINITIEVRGNGNLEDIKSFKPDIENVSVFDEKIVIKNSILTQKMVFVGDNDFVIPSFELKFFDPQIKEIKTVFTKEINIKVKNAKPKEELTIKKEKKVVLPVVEVVQIKTSSISNFIVFIVGLTLGILIMIYKPWKFFHKEKSVSIKEPKELLIKLFPYRDDENVQKIVDILEKNIYSDAKIEIDKKMLKEVMKKYF